MATRSGTIHQLEFDALAAIADGFGGPGEACRGSQPFSSVSPAYKGAGPHKLTGFQLSDYETERWNVDFPPDLPEAWVASTVAHDTKAFTDPRDYKQAQLVVCMSAPRIGTTIRTCSYSTMPSLGVPGSSVAVVSAYYDFQVFEARTGRLVNSFGIAGDEGGSYCPSSVASGTEAIAQAITGSALEDHLRDLVEGPPAAP